MFFVISDDHYFSLGIQVIFSDAGHPVQIIHYSGEESLSQIWPLGDTDILLLAMEDLSMLRKILRSCSSVNNGIALFLRMMPGGKTSSCRHGVIRKQIEPSLLLHEVIRSVRHQRLKRALQQLNMGQHTVLNGLINGMSHLSLARFMGISVKRVYGHKNEALASLGLGPGMNSRSLLIYSCLSQINGRNKGSL